MSNKKTLKEEGYKYIRYSVSHRAHILENPNGLQELWVSNKNHASFGLIYKNTHLEFCGEYKQFYVVSAPMCKAVLDE